MYIPELCDTNDKLTIAIRLIVTPLLIIANNLMYIHYLTILLNEILCGLVVTQVPCCKQTMT